MEENRSKELKKKKATYFIISLIVLLLTTLVLVALMIRNSSKATEQKEKLFTLSWSVTLTLIILIAATFLINQKVSKIIWSIDIFLGVMVGNKIGMIIVLVLYLFYDLLFGLYEKYKLTLNIRKEIDYDSK